MFSIKLVINPHAGKIRNNFLFINRLLKALNKNNILSEIVFTAKDGSDKEMFLHKLEDKHAIIVCGGDGTLNKIISYLIRADIYKPILFMPAGTVNVFCLEKNLSLNIENNIKLLLNGNRIGTDIGYVEHDKGTDYFLLMVGIGLDAHAVNEVDPNVKALLGKASYLFSGVKNFLTYKPKQICVEYDSKNEIKDVHSVIISNSRLYGGDIELFPEANMTDGFLDMCAFQPDNNLELLRSLVEIQSGHHVNTKDVHFKKIQKAFIYSDFKRIPFQIDGEFGGYLPIKVGILKKRIEFIL